jgi:pyruvate kinase
LTAKDRADLDAVSALAPAYVYLSYVDTAEDIQAVRQALARRRLSIPVIAKIERAVAVQNVATIAAEADALCLARGDLGVELPLPRLPEVQRQVVAAARAADTPVLLAGEVLLTTVQRPLPSRAELTDVTVALDQGCAGFVLSDETAVGCDPVAAVRWLQRIAAEKGRPPPIRRPRGTESP